MKQNLLQHGRPFTKQQWGTYHTACIGVTENQKQLSSGYQWEHGTLKHFKTILNLKVATAAGKKRKET